MLPLPNFTLEAPKTWAELNNCLANADIKTKIMAGGTDLIPNLKHGLYDISHIISLKFIKKLYIFDLTTHNLTLGANITLESVAINNTIKFLFPALAHAASLIASPHLRRMGTVGGNICLDTRCAYFNQSEFWRKALNYCLKKDGTCCHVTITGKRCVAASSNDLATILLAYDADINIYDLYQDKIIKLSDLYISNGEKNNILTAQQIITRVSIKKTSQTRAGFAKLRHRRSIDFPLLSIAVAFELDEHNKIQDGRLVINALVAKPKIFSLNLYKNSLYSYELVRTIAQHAQEKCHPLTNIADDGEWRKEMIEHYTLEAFMQAQPWE